MDEAPRGVPASGLVERLVFNFDTTSDIGREMAKEGRQETFSDYARQLLAVEFGDEIVATGTMRDAILAGAKFGISDHDVLFYPRQIVEYCEKFGDGNWSIERTKVLLLGDAASSATLDDDPVEVVPAIASLTFLDEDYLQGNRDLESQIAAMQKRLLEHGNFLRKVRENWRGGETKPKSLLDEELRMYGLRWNERDGYTETSNPEELLKKSLQAGLFNKKTWPHPSNKA